MSLDVSKLCLLVLQLLLIVHSKKYPSKTLFKDSFQAQKHEDLFLTRLHQHEAPRLRRSVNQELPMKKHRIRRDTKPPWCLDPTSLKDHEIQNEMWKFPQTINHLSFSMTWVGKDYKTVLLLATSEYFIFSIKSSALFKSSDFGVTFKNINKDIYYGSIRRNGLQRNPVDPDIVILISFSLPIIGRHSTLYITQDGTKSWKKVSLKWQVEGALEFHPRKKNWILAKASGLRGAYLSKDSGMTWSLLRSHVISVKWGARQDKMVDKEEQTILMTVAPVLQHGLLNIYDQELWRSRNLGSRFELIAKHVYSFGVQGPFLFVSVDLNRNNQTRIMHVSKDGGDTFDVAQVPSIRPEQFYSILDMSEGMVFLHVDDRGDTGKGVLYTSDADGIVFDKSLDNHLYTNFDGVTDFYKVESINGTYITARMNNDQSISTLISFDRGGEWNPIKLPDKKCEGIQIATKSASVCSLQIHNAFSRRVHVNVTKPPLSEATAVGLIIAHANPGYSLMKKDIGIWISRDGGYTWKETSLKGAYHYAIADHGNLILAIPDGPNPVKTLWYSVDQGVCWFTFQFSKLDNFHLTGLVTSPGAQTMRASVWGYTGTNRQWIAYTLNFRHVLEKKCLYNEDPNKSDYEKWQPHAENNNKGCLLGKKVTILRPKPNVLCFNGEDYRPMSSIEHCPCTMADLECDYGYYRKVGGKGKCLPDKSKKPKLCLHGEQIDVDGKGYRRIPGDECKKDGTYVEKYVDAHQRCQNASYYGYGMQFDLAQTKGPKSRSVVAAVVVPITIIAIVISVYFAKKYIDIKKSKPSYQYSSLPQEPGYNTQTDMLDSHGRQSDDEDAAMIEV